MPTRQELVLKRLQEEGRKTADYFGGLTQADLEQVVYTTGLRWRARDVLAHFVSAEQTLLPYAQQVLAGGRGAPDDFVIDEFNAIEVAGLRDVGTRLLVQKFENARAATAGMVAGMADADFDRIGRHPWFGRVPLEQMLKLVYRHNLLHERDVRRALETGQPVPHVDAQPRLQAQPPAG
jgi:DinB superfamily